MNLDALAAHKRTLLIGVALSTLLVMGLLWQSRGGPIHPPTGEVVFTPIPVANILSSCWDPQRHGIWFGAGSSLYFHDGASYQLIHSFGVGSGLFDVEYNRATGSLFVNNLYQGTYRGRGSTPSSFTFTRVDAGWSNPGARLETLANGAILAGPYGSGINDGLYLSIDDGDSWRHVFHYGMIDVGSGTFADGISETLAHVHRIYEDPVTGWVYVSSGDHRPKQGVMGASHIARSMDGGYSWVKIQDGRYDATPNNNWGDSHGFSLAVDQPTPVIRWKDQLWYGIDSLQGSHYGTYPGCMLRFTDDGRSGLVDVSLGVMIGDVVSSGQQVIHAGGAAVWNGMLWVGGTTTDGGRPVLIGSADGVSWQEYNEDGQWDSGAFLGYQEITRDAANAPFCIFGGRDNNVGWLATVEQSSWFGVVRGGAVYVESQANVWLTLMVVMACEAAKSLSYV
jgi:hypothetical protein